MHELIERRLGELRAELESGQRLERELAARQDELRCTLLRIGGAIQVLGELSADSAAAEAAGATPAVLRRVAER